MTNPLKDPAGAAVTPPGPWTRPFYGVLVTVAVVIAAIIWLPEHWIPVFASAVLFDLLTLAVFVGGLVRWAWSVHRLILETQDAESRR